jgi:hypothetical protein
VETPPETKKIVAALAEIMQATCEPERRDASHQSRRASVDDCSQYPGGSLGPDSSIAKSQESTRHSMQSGSLETNTDKLRDMLTSTRKNLIALMDLGVDRIGDRLLSLREKIVNKVSQSRENNLRKMIQ